MASAAQTSANRTAWSLKKLPTISGFYPLTRSAPRSPRRAQLFITCRLAVGGLGRGGLGVRQLEVRGDLPEIADDALVDGSLQDGEKRAQGLDRQAGLIEVPILLRQLSVAQRRQRVQRLDEEVADLELLQLLLELLDQLLVASHRRAPAAGAPARRRRRAPTRAPRAARTGARRRSRRERSGTARRRSPARPARPTRSAPRCGPAPGRPRHARSRSARR